MVWRCARTALWGWGANLSGALGTGDTGKTVTCNENTNTQLGVTPTGKILVFTQVPGL